MRRPAAGLAACLAMTGLIVLPLVGCQSVTAADDLTTCQQDIASNNPGSDPQSSYMLSDLRDCMVSAGDKLTPDCDPLTQAELRDTCWEVARTSIPGVHGRTATATWRWHSFVWNR